MEVSDIKIYKNGSWHTLRGSRILNNKSWHTLNAGSGIYKNGVWYTLKPLAFSVSSSYNISFSGGEIGGGNGVTLDLMKSGVRVSFVDWRFTQQSTKEQTSGTSQISCQPTDVFDQLRVGYDLRIPSSLSGVSASIVVTNVTTGKQLYSGNLTMPATSSGLVYTNSLITLSAPISSSGGVAQEISITVNITTY